MFNTECTEENSQSSHRNPSMLRALRTTNVHFVRGAQRFVLLVT